jgi:hypothetical protein
MREVAVGCPLGCDVDVGQEQTLRVDCGRPLATSTIGIGRSSRRCSIFVPSVRVVSHVAGLKISPRLGPSISSMNESPVPVMTSALLALSSEIS